ncbi:hypothetical protein BD626DRAFT_500403 [Schizophyllum amplum]|uniref:Uncharacterized protein n=1 Tax=Schizophyllum amplum TaxID=97359 RepID=A0A550CAB9_9AGAR|nr:hypothetical protein BD626DRAFT_500403 [Auriculariopsis ampla]
MVNNRTYPAKDRLEREGAPARARRDMLDHKRPGLRDRGTRQIVPSKFRDLLTRPRCRHQRHQPLRHHGTQRRLLGAQWHRSLKILPRRLRTIRQYDRRPSVSPDKTRSRRFPP